MKWARIWTAAAGVLAGAATVAADTKPDAEPPPREVGPPPRVVELGPAPRVVAAKTGGRPGEVITPPAKGERNSDKLQVGDPAPDFTLPLVKGKGEVTLSAFRGKRPVVLIFASYT
jgi:hypothetical protein